MIHPVTFLYKCEREGWTLHYISEHFDSLYSSSRSEEIKRHFHGRDRPMCTFVNEMGQWWVKDFYKSTTLTIVLDGSRFTNRLWNWPACSYRKAINATDSRHFDFILSWMLLLWKYHDGATDLRVSYNLIIQHATLLPKIKILLE